MIADQHCYKIRAKVALVLPWCFSMLNRHIENHNNQAAALTLKPAINKTTTKNYSRVVAATATSISAVTLTNSA